MKSKTAIATLIESKLAGRGWKLTDLANALAPENPERTLAKLQAVMAGRRCRQPHAGAICRALAITTEEHQAARKADKAALWDAVAEEQRQRFTPHLWIEVKPGWWVSLLTITGPDIYRKVKVPEEWAALEDEAQIIRQVGGFVRAHFESKNLRVSKEELVSYLYRREFELGYRFTPEGQFMMMVTGRYLAPVVTLRLG